MGWGRACRGTRAGTESLGNAKGWEFESIMSGMWSGFGFYLAVFCCFEEPIHTLFLVTYCHFCFNGTLTVIFLDHPFLSLRTSHLSGILWRSQAHHLTPTIVKNGSGLKHQWMFNMVGESLMRSRTCTQRRKMFESQFLSNPPTPSLEIRTRKV